MCKWLGQVWKCPDVCVSGGQDSEGGAKGETYLSLLCHHDSQGAETAASLSPQPRQGGGVQQVRWGYFWWCCDDVICLVAKVSDGGEAATELHLHTQQVQGAQLSLSVTEKQLQFTSLYVYIAPNFWGGQNFIFHWFKSQFLTKFWSTGLLPGEYSQRTGW